MAAQDRERNAGSRRGCCRSLPPCWARPWHRVSCFSRLAPTPRPPCLRSGKGAFGSWRTVTETLVKATPLIFTGLATAIAFRARIWNIGAEGQVFAGAMFAYWCQSAATGMPAFIQLPIVIAGAMIGGALYAGLAAVLKTAFRVDEVISTVMLNYHHRLCAFSSPAARALEARRAVSSSRRRRSIRRASCPRSLEEERLHLGIVLALIAALRFI